MEKTKPTVNAKKFLQDFRSGKSDQELMRRHGLDQRGLTKVLHLLVERKLLDEADLLASHSFRPEEPYEPPPSRKPVPGSAPRPDQPPLIHGSYSASGTKCPQCGATVSTKVLTCPECGHVLPGEERWANLEPEKGFFDRVPPKLLGILIALPAAALLFYVFRDMILPMAELKAEKQRKEIQDTLEQSHGPMQAAKEVVAKRGLRGLEAVIERLMGQEIIQRVEPDYSIFVAGARWNEISSFDKERSLSEIRSALIKANLSPEFDVNDAYGGLLVRVKRSSMSFGPFDTTSEPTASAEEDEQAEEESAEPAQEERSTKDHLRKTLERRLAPPARLPPKP
jgi:hypothetical protein